jgi:microcystin degradation protein MlrC
VRIATGAIVHETNTFSAYPTTLDDFKYTTQAPESVETGYIGPKDFFRALSDQNTEVGGFIDASKKLGFELVPTIWADATPGGPVTSEAFDYLLKKLLDGLRNCGKVDGVLLNTQGAAYSEAYHDMDGKILKEVRAVVGEDTPIVSFIDFHSNVSQLQVDNADVLVGGDLYPHTDFHERGVEAAEILVSIIKGRVKPTMAMEKPPIIIPLHTQFTGRYPMNTLVEEAQKMELEEGVLNVTVSASFPFTDSPDTGMAVLVTTNDDLKLAKEKAKQLSDLAWKLRKNFIVPLTPAEQAVKEATSEGGPTILAEMGDNPGAGGACDGTTLLAELMKAGAKRTVVGVITDPEAVAKAIEKGVGNKITMKIGGKFDKMSGEPVEVTGYIRLISDGEFTIRGPFLDGLKAHMGRTVVLDCDGIEVILTELRRQPRDLQQFRSVGIEPSERQIIVLKACVHFRAAFTPIVKKIIEVDTPGATPADLRRLSFQKVRRPIFPLDDI